MMLASTARSSFAAARTWTGRADRLRVLPRAAGATLSESCTAAEEFILVLCRAGLPRECVLSLTLPRPRRTSEPEVEGYFEIPET